jgi:hypothetical protein
MQVDRSLPAMMRLLCLLLAAGLTRAADTVEFSAAFPRDPEKTGTMRVARVEAEVTMRGMLAETSATLTLAMDADPKLKMEGRLVFPLPPDCVITGAALDIGDIMRPASVTLTATAQAAYNSVVSRMLDPVIIQLLPDGRVSAKVFPFLDGKPRKLRLEFAQTVLPGQTWRFPIKFAAPVPVAVLNAEERKDFTGDWSLPALPAAEELAAHPDGTGRFVFHTLLSPGEPAPPPRHLLLLADVSLLQAPRDSAAERAFLERLLQQMQTGRVTLPMFSTELHSQAEFAVQDGKCEPLLSALAALTFDGAPRPGAVDVSAVPADFTLIMSTLAAPMGGGAVPRLPARAPVWVLDSVSPAPSSAARQLAESSGGQALDPRRESDLFFRLWRAVTTQGISTLRFHPLADGGWMVSGELTASSSGVFTAGGMTRTVRQGADATAGALIARQRGRAEFLQLLNSGALPARLRDARHPAPLLTPGTSFIVLEQKWDYQSFGIALPPDLQKDAAPVDEKRRHDDSAGLQEYDRALRRPLGTKGDPAKWFARTYGDKWLMLEMKANNAANFEFVREHSPDPPRLHSWWEKHWGYPLQRNDRSASIAEMEKAGESYRAAPKPGPEAIRQAKELQVEAAAVAELFSALYGDGDRSSPSSDPFAGPADAFSGAGAGSGWGAGRGAGGGASPPTASAEPFGNPNPAPTALAPAADPAPAPPPAASPAPGAPQIPQTFGGGGGWPWGGGLFGEGPFSSDDPVGLPARRKPVNPETPAALRTESILARATPLHRAGQKAAALRALSVLAISGQDDHARLRLLAWVLQEWGEHALALEVQTHAEERFGVSDTTLRDRALLLQAAGRKDEALTLLRQSGHHVAWRDAAALEGRMSAALRVVVEVAGADGDADLEVLGPDYELCHWRNPLPSFGGTLSFDGTGMAPEDFVLPALPKEPLQLRVRLHASGPRALRVTVIENWGREGERRQFMLFRNAARGLTRVIDIGTDGLLGK